MMRALKLHILRFCRDERGATAVEFGMVATAFLIFIVGIYAAGMYFLTYNRLQQGVENAARYAAVHADATNDELEDIIIENIASVGGIEDNLEIAVADSAANGITFREVSATYEFNWNLPLLPNSVDDLSMQVTSRTPVPN